MRLYNRFFGGIWSRSLITIHPYLYHTHPLSLSPRVFLILIVLAFQKGVILRCLFFEVGDKTGTRGAGWERKRRKGEKRRGNRGGSGGKREVTKSTCSKSNWLKILAIFREFLAYHTVQQRLNPHMTCSWSTPQTSKSLKDSETGYLKPTSRPTWRATLPSQAIATEALR